MVPDRNIHNFVASMLGSPFTSPNDALLSWFKIVDASDILKQQLLYIFSLQPILYLCPDLLL